MTDFKILSDACHIRQRFSMYGGSQVVQEETTFLKGSFEKVEIVAGLLKIINEIIDNSVDEHVRTNKQFATKIDISITPDGMISVTDNGRGIPSNKIQTPDGLEYQMVAAFTRARAGSNFDDSKRDSIGANGVGSMITFVTSEVFDAVSCDGTSKVRLVGNNGQVVKVTEEPSDKKGTTVKFKPDYAFFGLSGIDKAHIAMIEERIRSLSLAFSTIKFKFNGKSVNLKFNDYFGQCEQFQTEFATYGVAKSDGSFQSHSIVNGLSVKSGTHIDYFINPIIAELRELLKRRKKIEITAARLKQHLRIHCVVNGFSALKFDSQTKERITNSVAECKEAIGDFDAAKFAKKLMANEDLINEITAYTRLQEDLAAKKDLSKLEKTKRVKSDKFFPAVGKPKTLIITEGNSACSGLIKCLGRQGNAFYAMKGVPLNVLEVSHQKFVANAELSELYSIITSYPEIDIAIATDADADGSRIRGLVILFLHMYFPEHVSAGKIKVLRTPLAIGKRKNVIKEWAYTFEDVSKLDQTLDIQYQKGLGSWSVDDLRAVIAKDTMDKMLPIVDINDPELLDKWFSSSTSDFRKDQILQAAPFDIMRI